MVMVLKLMEILDAQQNDVYCENIVQLIATDARLIYDEETLNQKALLMEPCKLLFQKRIDKRNYIKVIIPH